MIDDCIYIIGMPRNKNGSLTIQITQPNPPSKSLAPHPKELQIRERHQIQQMQNQVKKLTDKIEAERQLLRNRILCQELEHELKKNQIAAKMSKREIILNRLNVIKGGDRGQGKKKGSKAISKNKQKGAKQQQYNSELYTEPKVEKSIEKVSSLPKLKQRSNSRAQLFRLQRLKAITSKQKQYGNRVQKQFHSNRAKSAQSYLTLQKLSDQLQKKHQQELTRILSQKKPSLPIQISQTDRLKQIDRIRNSSQPSALKLEQLNYLAQVELSRVERGELRGKEPDLGVLDWINRARTQIMLRGW